MIQAAYPLITKNKRRKQPQTTNNKYIIRSKYDGMTMTRLYINTLLNKTTDGTLEHCAVIQYVGARTSYLALIYDLV